MALTRLLEWWGEARTVLLQSNFQFLHSFDDFHSLLKLLYLAHGLRDLNGIDLSLQRKVVNVFNL
jgi:hypothetical protein